MHKQKRVNNEKKLSISKERELALYVVMIYDACDKNIIFFVRFCCYCSAVKNNHTCAKVVILFIDENELNIKSISTNDDAIMSGFIRCDCHEFTKHFIALN